MNSKSGQKSRGMLAGAIICIILTIGFSMTAVSSYITPKANLDNTTEYSATVYSVFHKQEKDEDYYLITINEYNQMRLRMEADEVINRNALDSLSKNTKIYFRLWGVTLEDFQNSLKEHPTLENQIGIWALRTETEDILTLDSSVAAQKEENSNNWIVPTCIAIVCLVSFGIFLFYYLKLKKNNNKGKSDP